MPQLSLPSVSNLGLRETQGLPELHSPSYSWSRDDSLSVVDLTLRKGGAPSESWSSDHWDCAAASDRLRLEPWACPLLAVRF